MRSVSGVGEGRPRVNRENLGAWVLKCNPAVTDLRALIEHGVRTWCVQDNYRSALFEDGQPAFLWVSGSARATPTPGFWAVGSVTGPAEWRAPAAGESPKYVVPLALEFLPEPVSRVEVVAQPGLAEVEVIRQPQMSNPSFLTRAEYERLRELLPSGVRGSRPAG
ncbi:hypothetical protein GCM10009789_54390 [Kribbella sancticallisti]|uniref:EVE domain-containing protein n=1 Tax=Kribbella sancticallisti TaxID=460087 RepID=A0ABN2E464_9ACTN